MVGSGSELEEKRNRNIFFKSRDSELEIFLPISIK